jgi:hypothetical protein
LGKLEIVWRHRVIGEDLCKIGDYRFTSLSPIGRHSVKQCPLYVNALKNAVKVNMGMCPQKERKRRKGRNNREICKK